ncbi:hypothetical protein GTY56_20940 [Streptomyces sp. SID5643]|nr:hypothetical protein [Streptomyces sp. SID5643]
MTGDDRRAAVRHRTSRCTSHHGGPRDQQARSRQGAGSGRGCGRRGGGRTLPGTGHNVPREAPAAFARAVVDADHL